MPEDVWQEEERTRDRTTRRRVEVYAVPQQEAPFCEWPHMQRVVWVERGGTRGGTPFQEAHVYISSQPNLPAKEAALQVRGHWEIENRLHWVKDVVQQEDACTTRAGQAPQNLALLRSWVLTLYRRAGHTSLARALRFYAHNLPSLYPLLE